MTQERLTSNSNRSKAVFNNTPIIESEYTSDSTTLVVDIGSFCIKYSLFSTFDDKIYLLKTDLKDSSNILGDGKINFNLLKRDITRKLDAYNNITKIDRVVIIPPNSSCQYKVIPYFEYKEKTTEFNKAVKEEYKEIQSKSYTFDWMKTGDYPEKDIQFVVLDSMQDEVIYDLNSILVTLPVDEYIIASPLTAYLRLSDLDEPLMVVDLGHRGTKVVVVDKGNIVIAEDSGIGGFDLSLSMNQSNSTSMENITIKHNSSIDEFPSRTNHYFETISQTMSDVKKKFDSRHKSQLTKFIVIGGGASMEVEKEFNIETTGMERVYYNLGIENGKKIPYEIKNYLAISKSTIDYLDEVRGEHSKYIDLSAPKQSIGLKVKSIANIFESVKKPLYVAIVSILVSAILVGEGSKTAVKYKNTMVTENATYVNTLNSVYETNNTLNNEYNTLLYSLPENTGNQLNTGIMLRRLREITPPKFNIQIIKLNGNGNSGEIVVKSESQVMVSTFLTLLQDDSSGIFNKANIIDIDIVESMGSKYYVTTIYVEGRTL